MNEIIKLYDYVRDDDLNLCFSDGVAYQVDRKDHNDYNGKYYTHCLEKYTDEKMKAAINKGRIEFVWKHFGRDTVLDIGVGAGDFIKAHGNADGYDVDKEAVKWLKDNFLYSKKFKNYDAFTMWDVLEHVLRPEKYFKHMRKGSTLFLSIPIFKDLTKVRESKHYRPGEHWYYFTENGLINFLGKYGFILIEKSDFEKKAGREQIYNFALGRVY